MAKLLLLHAPHVVPRFSSSSRSLVSASALYRRPLLVNPQFSHIVPRLRSPCNRTFSARAFDDSVDSSSDMDKEKQEQLRDGISRERDEDYPTGEMDYENRNVWESFIVKLRMLFAFPWQRIRKGSVLTMKLRGQISDQLKSRFSSGLSLPQLSENFVKAAYDPRIAGVYLHIDPLSCGWGKVEEIRRHILDFKKSGHS